MKKIFINGKNGKGKFILVDKEDFPYLSKHKWFYGDRYAKTAIWNYDKKKQFQKKVHQLIVDIPFGMTVDHINRDTLDNRRKNLRICTISQNNQNRRKQKNNKLGYKGVYLASMLKKCNVTKKYRAVIQGNLIGYFRTVEEAATSYNQEAIKRFGDFAVLNKI